MCIRDSSLLIVTFDEDDNTPVNQIATMFVGARIKPGNYSERIDHFTVLRTIEAMYGLPALGSAANRSAITDVFAPAPDCAPQYNQGFNAGFNPGYKSGFNSAFRIAYSHNGSWRLAHVSPCETEQRGTLCMSLHWFGTTHDTVGSLVKSVGNAL